MSDDPRYQFVLVINWIFELTNGVKTSLPMELGVEKDVGFIFGRDGNHVRHAPPTTPPQP